MAQLPDRRFSLVPASSAAAARRLNYVAGRPV